MSTLTVFPVAGANSPCDGGIQTTNQTNYTTAHDLATGEAASATDTELLGQNGKGGSNYFINRSIMNFDTSALTSGATISAAVLSLFYRSDKTSVDTGAAHGDQQIVAATPAGTNTVTTSDFPQFGTTVFATRVYGDFSSGVYYDFTLDSNGRANISKTAISKFGLRAKGDVSALTPTGNNYVSFYSADQTGTSNDPKLVITYTAVVGPANLKTYNTNAAANIKTINTNVIANVKTLDTNA